MAQNITSKFETTLRAWMFQGVAFTPSGTLGIAILTNAPSESITGANMSEVTNVSTAYARQGIT
jgi:hypothetical protein